MEIWAKDLEPNEIHRDLLVRNMVDGLDEHFKSDEDATRTRLSKEWGNSHKGANNELLGTTAIGNY